MSGTENYSSESSLDEEWLHELTCIVNCFVKGENLHEDTLSKEVNQDLIVVCGNFKDDKLKLQALAFDDAEVEQTVQKMPKISKKSLKAAKLELEQHLQHRASMPFN